MHSNPNTITAAHLSKVLPAVPADFYADPLYLVLRDCAFYAADGSNSYIPAWAILPLSFIHQWPEDYAGWLSVESIASGNTEQHIQDEPAPKKETSTLVVPVVMAKAKSEPGRPQWAITNAAYFNCHQSHYEAWFPLEDIAIPNRD